jgi:hypothetical protein
VEKEVEDPGGLVSPAAGRKRRTVPSKEEQDTSKKLRQDPRRLCLHQRRQYDEMVVKARFLGCIKDPYKQKLREAIGNRVESYSLSIVKAFPVLMHLVKEIYNNVTDTKKVEVPEEFFNETVIRHRMVSTWDMSTKNERVCTLHKKYAEYRLNGTR